MIKRSLAILLPDLRGGGAERVSVDLARAIAAVGCAVEFVVMRAEGELLVEARRGFPVVDLGASKMRHVPIKLARYMKERRPDAVIANMWPLTSAAVIARALSRHKHRLLLVEHNTLSRQYASWGPLHAKMMALSLMATHRFADKIGAVSDGAAEDLASIARMSRRRVEVLHNPIPQRQVPSPAALRDAEALWNCTAKKRLLTVGSLKHQKNHALLLRAFAALGDAQARLMIVGKGENEASLRSLASELGVAGRVIFAGFREDPSAYYATADLFVLSSNYEGLPTVLIEALSFGQPVVSTDCPSGPAEILGAGRWGQLVPVGDAASLTLAMRAGLSTPIDRAEQRRRATDFSPERAAKRYLEVLFGKGDPG